LQILPFDFLTAASFEYNQAMNKTTILIVDDHQLIRQTWSFILNNNLGYNVTGECSNAKDAVELAASLRPDIIILDINLPGMSGVEAVPHLLASSPSSKILAVSTHNQPVYARRMIKNGAMGYVCKNSSSQEMFQALQEVKSGKRYICEEIKEVLANQIISNEGENKFKTLSDRELEVIRYIKKGFSSKEMAEKLFISVKTVEVHRFNILKKLHLKNTAALVNYINVNSIEDLV